MVMLEKYVLSGLSFWEDGDEALFNDENDDNLISPQPSEPGSRQTNYIQNIGYKNELAT